MLIVAVLSSVLAAASMGVSLVLALRIRALEERFRAQQLPLVTPALALPEPVPARPLEGLRIALDISQDHPHPVLANLLKEHLLLEDVADVSFVASPEWHDAADILIRGRLVCNGYAEIYYDAEIDCLSPNETICALSEKPAHGDRPSNLAIEVVNRLKVELEKLVTRNERRRAIRELHGG